MKITEKSSIDCQSKVDQLSNEITIHKKLVHPFIVKYYDSFQSKRKLHFILELCPGGEMFYFLRRVGKLTEEQAKFYFIEIMLALEHLHSLNIIYRDLKPENILLGLDGHIKLADFGLSKDSMTQQTISHSFCGSPEYMSPEMLKQQGHSRALDYYSLGVILYNMVMGVPPYYDKNTDTMYNKILHEQLSFPIQVSKELRNLLEGLLNKNPPNRLGYSRGTDEFKEHNWLRGIDYNLFLGKKISPPFKVFLTAYNFDPEYTLPSLDFSHCKKEHLTDFSFHLFQSSQQYYEKCYTNSIKGDNKSMESQYSSYTKQCIKIEKSMNKNKDARNVGNAIKTGCNMFNTTCNQCSRKVKQEYYKKELIYSNSGLLSHSLSKSKLNETYPTLTPLFITNLELSEPREIILPNSYQTTLKRKVITPKNNPMSRILRPLKKINKFDCKKCGNNEIKKHKEGLIKKPFNDELKNKNSSKQCHSSPDVNYSNNKVLLPSETNFSKDYSATPHQVMKFGKAKPKMVSIDLNGTRSKVKN